MREKNKFDGDVYGFTMKNNPWRPVLLYSLFGFMWILFSDRILSLLVSDMTLYHQIQTYKGWFYVAITAMLLYMLIRLENHQIYSLSNTVKEKSLELAAYVEETAAMDQELRDQLDRMNNMVYYDQLTGLKNRFSFEEDIQRLLSEDIPFAVYYIDVDHFKNLNDIHGHYYGDHFLKNFGHSMSQAFDKLDLYRWGGDEFVFIDAVNRRDKVQETVDHILKMSHRTWHIKEVEFHTSTSIGVVLCPEQGRDINTIFKNLEVAVYKAKEGGRARCVMFDQMYLDIIERRSHIEQLVNTALSEDGFHLIYQPIYDLKNQQLYRLEVLLRCNKLSELNAGIGELISVAEQTGQIHRIDDWVMEKVFSEMAEKKKRLPGMKVAVNISSQTFTSSKFQNNLEQLLNTYQVEPCDIEFEITEHTILKDLDISNRIMKSIKSLGFQLALDDFGTRYSSLNYLSRLPFDMLKIDKSYVDNILSEGHDMVIVKQIISLAGAIGLETVAEGIESAEQEEILLAAGCDYGQGYHYSRPMSFDQVVETYADK